MTYTPPARYTPAELDSAALDDLLTDARVAERHADELAHAIATGNVNKRLQFHCDTTPDSLRAYAAKCRQQAETYRDGGAHIAVIAR